MNQETEQKHVEHKKHEGHKEHVVHKEEKHEEKKSEVKINLTRLGKNRKEALENLGIYVTIVSAIIFALGILIGTFVQGTIFLSVIGSFFIMVGIVIYIASQFLKVQ